MAVINHFRIDVEKQPFVILLSVVLVVSAVQSAAQTIQFDHLLNTFSWFEQECRADVFILAVVGAKQSFLTNHAAMV